MSLFQDAISQQIDDDGKTRIVNFEIGDVPISLCIQPIPPLAVPSENIIYYSDEKSAKVLMKEKGITLKQKTRDGLYGSHKDLYICYIPLRKPKQISSNSIPPVIGEEAPSKLKTMRRNRKIAEFLKEYALFTYAHFQPEKIEDIFIVVPTHEYEIERLDKKLFFENNDVMYEDGLMIVTSDEMKARLISYVRVKILNNSKFVEDMKNKTVIDTYYQGLVDFRANSEEIIFTSKLGVWKWKQSLKYEDNHNYIFPRMIPFIPEPYYFRSSKIAKNKLLIVQNVEEGNLKRAVTVSIIWKNERINKGFNCPISDKTIPYKVWNIKGEIIHDDEDEGAEIYEYSPDNYAALLVL